MDVRARVLASGAAASAAIAVAACGSSGHPAAADTRSSATLISQMKTAVSSATSMHMAGQFSEHGRAAALDLGVLRAGGLAGTITQNGVSLQLIGAQGKVYVKATPRFLRELRESKAVCTLMCGKYVQMTGPEGSQLAGGLSMTSLTRTLVGGLPKFSRAGTTTVGGQPAIVLHGADGSVLDVAAHGKPYPLRVVAPASRAETVVFSRWDAVAPPAAPPAGQVINLNQLNAGSS